MTEPEARIEPGTQELAAQGVTTELTSPLFLIEMTNALDYLMYINLKLTKKWNTKAKFEEDF